MWLVVAGSDDKKDDIISFPDNLCITCFQSTVRMLTCTTPQILNGEAEGVPLDFVQVRTEVEFSCNPGYVLNGGNHRHCIVPYSNVTEWDEPLPVCTGIHTHVHVVTYVHEMFLRVRLKLFSRKCTQSLPLVGVTLSDIHRYC